MTSATSQMTRMLALVPYLQRRDGVPLSQLATEFETTPRQLRRDLQTLVFCGLPGLYPGDLIEVNFEAFEDDADGLVQLTNAEFLQRPLRLSADEAVALAVAVRTIRASAPGEVRAIADRVLEKLETASAAGSGALLANPDVREPAERLIAHRDALQRAIREDRRVRITYYVPARDQAGEREVSPYLVAPRNGVEYLIGWCHQVDDQRTFRLDRIDSVELVDAARSVPTEVDGLPEALFQAGPEALEAVLLLEPSARWAAEYYGAHETEELADGVLKVRLKAADAAWLERVALGLGGRATLLEPIDVAESVRKQAARALAAYDS